MYKAGQYFTNNENKRPYILVMVHIKANHRGKRYEYTLAEYPGLAPWHGGRLKARDIRRKFSPNKTAETLYGKI